MNETTVDRIKALCKSKGIAISRLEKDLGFSNGYIGQLRKGTINSQRLQQIAEYCILRGRKPRIYVVFSVDCDQLVTNRTIY